MKRCCSLLTLLLLVLCGCSTTGDPLGMAYNGRTVNLKVGEVVEIQLGANLTREGHWNIVQLDRSIVDLKKEHKPEAQVAVGGLPRLYFFQYDFKALQRGETTLRMEQDSVDSEDPVAVFEVHFVVN